ncbi:hypothetical protein CDD81_2695 [Ophiocordyceps australis]|uniref:FAD/NAD(P)-binding domain-containing protein n=1 Tax=Ophiocordyceps australis TaxID=1399860 RepID=A0A2C5YCD4_9HYPO|nr:hypothetical protein CDD81_2695 [Ophiocordyceps australis]
MAQRLGEKDAATTKTVVVLGGSLGGLAVVHRLLKYTLPRLKHLRLVLVSKNSHFYWNLASVRAVIPGAIADDDVLQPIEPGLQQYPPGSIDFMVGAATALDPEAKKVTVHQTPEASRHGQEQDIELGYDLLVVATGTRPLDIDMPWKAAGSYSQCVASLHDTASRIGAASHIVVAGGGATGVELAAEIRCAGAKHSPQKTVVLLSSSEVLVGGDGSAERIKKELRRLGIQVRLGVKATQVDNAAHHSPGKTLVRLSDGSDLLTDLYIPTTGQVPNSEFLPHEWLTDKGLVETDDRMRVLAAPKHTWAVGDIVAQSRPGFLSTEAQAAGVAHNIERVLQGKDQQIATGPFVDAFLCCLGPSRGAGHIGPIPTPSFLVWAFKGRTLGVEKTPKFVNGTMW